MQSLGSVLRKARASRNLTIREASEKLGLAPGYISEIETGKKVPDKDETLESFSRVYQISVLDLRLLASLKNESEDVPEFDLDDIRLRVARRAMTSDPHSEFMKRIRSLLDGGDE